VRLIRSFVAALLSLLVVVPAAAAAKPPARFFGVMADGPLDNGSVPFASQMSAMRSARVGSVRIAVYWSDMQPYPTADAVPAEDAVRFRIVAGIPTDFTQLDQRVAAAARARLDLLPVVVRTPLWARSEPGEVGSPPKSAASYAAFMTALIDRYGPRGSLWKERKTLPRRPLRRWQVWNEPELIKYFSPARNPNGWAKPYVRLLRSASRAIRKADRGATVVAAGLTGRTWIDLRKIYRAGGRRWFDVAAIHPFSKRVDNVIKIIRLTRIEMKRAGDGRKQLALTEVSWSSGQGRSTLNYGWETTEAGQAARIRSVLPKLAARRKSYRLAGVWWYTWASRPIGSVESFDYAGLRRQTTGSKLVSKPALSAWRSTVKRLRR
jgi:hypothetical protein